MMFLVLVTILALGNALTIKRQESCSNPVTRKEWRDLTDLEKSSYLEVVQCLKNTPSRLGTAADSLYDDFAYVHMTLDTTIHNVAVFLPWHRWFVSLYEKALQEECGYDGNMVYWNWEKDSSAPAAAPVFNTSDLGFGGTTASTSGCVINGAFADLQVSTPNSHCLQRSFNAGQFTRVGSPSAVNQVVNLSTFALFHPALEGGPHLSAHGGLGGDMGRNYSPNDPLFFLHHANIDRIWWRWQSESASRRTEYSGRRYQNDSSTQATLSDPNPMVSGFADTDVLVSQVMWVRGGILCYTY